MSCECLKCTYEEADQNYSQASRIWYEFFDQFDWPTRKAYFRTSSFEIDSHEISWNISKLEQKKKDLHYYELERKYIETRDQWWAAKGKGECCKK